MNRQVWIVLVTMLIALALPLAGVILTLESLTKREPQESGPGVSEALQNMLEGIADEKLAPEELRGSEARIELIADELNGEKDASKGSSNLMEGLRFRHLRVRRRSGSWSRFLASILRSSSLRAARGRRGGRSMIPLAVFWKL